MRQINPRLNIFNKYTKMGNIINPYTFGGLPRTNLKLEWLMSGNANDTSGNGNNGIPTSVTLTTDRKSIANSAYSFTSSSKIVATTSTGTLDYSRKFSINFWIKVTDFSYTAVPVFVTVDNGTSFPVSIGFSPSNVSFLGVFYKNALAFASGANQQTNNSSSILVGQWNMITLTYNGLGAVSPLNYTLYVNSLPQTTVSSPGSLGVPPNITCVNWTTLPFKGSFDDLRIYDGTQLTQAEITTLYNE